MRLKRKRSIRRSVTHRSRIDGKGHFWALRDIDLTVTDGETIAVVGGNGAGKSTLLLTLAGIITGGLVTYSVPNLFHQSLFSITSTPIQSVSYRPYQSRAPPLLIL